MDTICSVPEREPLQVELAQQPFAPNTGRVGASNNLLSEVTDFENPLESGTELDDVAS
jgi:hypothetical protein